MVVDGVMDKKPVVNLQRGRLMMDGAMNDVLERYNADLAAGT